MFLFNWPFTVIGNLADIVLFLHTLPVYVIHLNYKYVSVYILFITVL